MSDSTRASLVELLYEGRANGVVEATAELNELTRAQGLAVQLAVLDRLRANGEELGGWKVGMTSGPAHDHMGEGFRPFGYILTSRTFRSGSSVPMGQGGPTSIEPEIAFRIERPLSGSTLSPEQVREAVSGGIPAFELLESRLTGSDGHGGQIADNLAHWGLVIGEVSGWKGDIGDVDVTLRNDHGLDQTIGPHYLIDDPFESVAALCRSLDDFDLGLQPGQHVITGAFYRTRISDPSAWTAQFREVGTVTASFSSAP